MGDACRNVFANFAAGAVSVCCQFWSPLFLLAGNRSGWSLPGARIGVRALSPGGQPAAMTKPAIASKIHHPLDVHLNVPAQRAFDGVVAVNVLAKHQNFAVRQFIEPPGLTDAEGVANIACGRMADAVNTGQCDRHTLARWKVNALYSRQFYVLS